MTPELLLTPSMAIACLKLDLEQRLAARKLLRPYRQQSARKGVETKRKRGCA